MADETQSGDLTEQYLQSVEARKLEADRQMQKLIDALNVRKNMPFDPMLMRVAGALLSPTKTGSFGESLGYATTAAAEEAEKQAARGIDVAKLEFELGQKMREQQATAEQQKFAMQYLSQPQGQVPAQPAQLTAAPPVAAAELSAEPQMSTPEAPAVLPQEMPKASLAPAAGGAPAGSYVPRQVDPRLAFVNPTLYDVLLKTNEAARKEAEFRLKEREAIGKDYMPLEIGGIKKMVYIPDYHAMLQAIKQEKFDVAEKFYTEYGFEFPYVKDKGGYRPKTAAEAAEEIELAKGIETKSYPISEVGGNVKMLPKQYRDYLRAVEQGKGEEWVDKNIRRKPSGGEAPKAEAKPVMTEEQIAARAKSLEEYQTQVAKDAAKQRGQVMEAAQNALALEQPVKNIYKIASDPIRSKALGILEDNTLADAVLGVVAEGGKAGSYVLGIPGIREAVAKVSGDEKEQTKILDSLQALKGYFGQVNLLFSRIYLANQGAVTEGERALVAQAIGGVQNRKVVALAQAEMLQQRMAFDTQVKAKLLKWEKANPGGRYDEFTETKEFKDLYMNFARNSDAVYNKYFGSTKPEGAQSAPEAAAASTAPSSGGSLRDRINAEKKARGLQ